MYVYKAHEPMYVHEEARGEQKASASMTFHLIFRNRISHLFGHQPLRPLFPSLQHQMQMLMQSRHFTHQVISLTLLNKLFSDLSIIFLSISYSDTCHSAVKHMYIR